MGYKLRTIVKDAFKCDALVYQFQQIDVEDGVLYDGSKIDVNLKKSDEEIVADAKNRLDICMDEWNQEDPIYRKEARQLKKFLTKHDNKD